MNRFILLSALTACSGQPAPGSAVVVLSASAGDVLPGQEEVRCVELRTPARDIYVSGVTIEKRGVHHVNVWRGSGAAHECQGEFMWSDSSSGQLTIDVPEGSLWLKPATLLLLDVHVINTTPERVAASVSIAVRETERVEPMLYGVSLRMAKAPAPVQPGATVTATLVAPPAALRILSLIGHQHAHGTLEVARFNGAEIYRSVTWSDPTVALLSLDVTMADRLEWSCTVENTSAAALTWGQNSVQTSEMCGLTGLGTAPWSAGAQE